MIIVKGRQHNQWYYQVSPVLTFSHSYPPSLCCAAWQSGEKLHCQPGRKTKKAVAQSGTGSSATTSRTQPGPLRRNLHNHLHSQPNRDLEDILQHMTESRERILRTRINIMYPEVLYIFFNILSFNFPVISSFSV